MPIYVYKCTECETKYDVFHKTKENEDDIICPKCNSKSYKKLMASTNFSGLSSSGASYPEPSINSGGCSSGMCGLN